MAVDVLALSENLGNRIYCIIIDISRIANILKIRAQTMNCLFCMTEPPVLGRVRTGAILPHDKGTHIMAISTV
jgi:hypothetical protein